MTNRSFFKQEHTLIHLSIMKHTAFKILFFLYSVLFFGQENIEQTPPFYIKTVFFSQNGNFATPCFQLGQSFEFQFDDLYGNEADYYLVIEHFNKDWKRSDLSKAEYLTGLDNQRIRDYQNSYNTLQSYSHYTARIPNQFFSITKSGNYLLKIFNSDNELVISRKFILYEDLLSIGTSVRRARDFDSINEKQNIEIVINYHNYPLQNPAQNAHVSIFQNGNLNQGIHGIKPQYTLGTEMIYRYNKETQFWAGNEFYTLDTSDIRVPNNSVAKVTSGDIYNSFLYTGLPRKNSIYTFFPDFNGNFYIRNVRTVENENIEADYSWVYFSLNSTNLIQNNNIYIRGAFNNFNISEEYKMEYNETKNIFEKAVLLKQGYYNYQYILAENSKIDFENNIDGNFYQTENQYLTIVYYRGNNDRYDRIIGRSITNSETIKN